MGIFKANDIRGIYPDELNPEIIYKIGFFLPKILGADRILVGMDGRISSEAIFNILSSGIIDSGADVCTIGLCDTPAVYFATVKYEFDGSVMITASHNPANHNGLKISGRNSIPIGPSTGLMELQTLIANEVIPSVEKGKIEKKDIKKEYVEHVRKFLSGSIELKVVMDCGNGASSAFAGEIFKSVIPNLTVLLDEADGNFPHHGPNPLEKASWPIISKQIIEEQAELGVLFDGDGDRAIFFDEDGKFISPDIITSLIGHYFFKDGKETGEVFYDIRSSRSVSEYIAKLGGKAYSCVTGHARIKKLLKEESGVYAGELSGHYYFRDNFYCDSGFIAAAIVMSVLSELKTPLSQLVTEINPYSFSGEINFIVADQKRILNELPHRFSKGTVSLLDGIRLDYDSWWFNLRPSGAESLLRLVVEAGSPEEMTEKVSVITNEILALDSRCRKGV
ncbi:MAG: phosphomannomutase/phosphoglucomutase [Spirochaetales bacterium]|nr:phosphomannomutase/phosphoglucomutase [Spirochaetales bacterium]